MQQKAPSQLNHAAAYPRVARFGKSFLPPPRSAFVRSAGQTSVARYRSAVPQVPRQDLMYEHVSCLNADTDHLGNQKGHSVGSSRWLLLQPLEARRFNLLDLCLDNLQACHVTSEFGQGVRWQQLFLWRPQHVEALARVAQRRLEATQAKPSQDGLHAVGHLGAFTDPSLFMLTAL